MFEWKKYRIVAIKRQSGERISGTTEWDGLASLYAVKPDDGSETRFVSVLDTVVSLDLIGV
jgi:hypothetical protein